jgi:hypothetical protein
VLIELSPADVIVEVGSRGRVPKESGVHEHSPGADVRTIMPQTKPSRYCKFMLL